MEEDEAANIPDPPPPQTRNLVRPTPSSASDSNFPLTASSSSSSSSSCLSPSSRPAFVRQVQAAFKRHRPLGTMQSNSIRPKRGMVPLREAVRVLSSNTSSQMETKSSQAEALLPDQGHSLKHSIPRVRTGETQEDMSVWKPSMSGIPTTGGEENYCPLDPREDQPKPIKGTEEIRPSNAVSHYTDAEKKGSHQPDNLSSHLGSLALTEMELDVSHPTGGSTVLSQDMKQQNFGSSEMENKIKTDCGTSTVLEQKTNHVQEQQHPIRNFLQSDSSHPMTQSSVVGSSCATTTLIHSSSAPIVSSTTYSTGSLRGSHLELESYGDINLNQQPLARGDIMQPSYRSSKYTGGMPVNQSTNSAQAFNSNIDPQKEYCPCKEHHGCELKESKVPNDPSCLDDKPTKEKGFVGDVTDVQSQAPSSKNTSFDVKLDKPAKQQKSVNDKGTSAHRKRTYDPDLFFKVNGKLYQRLGKIGSGGSSEVHKVISSDCSIYALKKIKLKGRDYATAYGFCQEMEYLNNLKGKDHIIQLIDYEVTDKALLHAVISGSLINKDSRVREDGYIYMVLEYGEIDLAHMLSQKWKEVDDSDRAIDENWLRFYWQQILLAVNTIHEERIVHSDLKPANFLLVKGSLKLIDFGIAKAIMSDTTNIQRDSQVGTLSYMSPEAFMCNENDANGNAIKCGRPSDIWSLGCILYQMVYGRTPFSEYKTFWAKFKVITDQNHEIIYEPVSNPWLLDLMKKCLAWERNERWRIPQLLQHPFLVPPISPHLSSTRDQNLELLQLIAKACVDDQEASLLYLHLEQNLIEPESRERCCKLLCQMSKCCFQLQQHLSSDRTRSM